MSVAFLLRFAQYRGSLTASYLVNEQILMKYYYSSRLRKGLEYYLSNK